MRYVGGTWRVGGILALSRAFGDAYMKGSLQARTLCPSMMGEFVSLMAGVCQAACRVSQCRHSARHAWGRGAVTALSRCRAQLLAARRWHTKVHCSSVFGMLCAVMHGLSIALKATGWCTVGYLCLVLQFEGVRAGGDGYSSGFGVVAEPDTTLTELTGARHLFRPPLYAARTSTAGVGVYPQA